MFINWFLDFDNLPTFFLSHKTTALSFNCQWLFTATTVTETATAAVTATTTVNETATATVTDTATTDEHATALYVYFVDFDDLQYSRDLRQHYTTRTML